MANRPISYPQWVFSGPNVIQPPAPLAATGWAPGIAPDAQHVNWMLGDINAWIQYLDQLTNTGIPDQVIRLLNGGIWSFVASSGVLEWSQDANLAIPSVPDSSNTIPAGNVTLTDGEIAYAVANIPSQSTGSINNGTDIIYNMNFTGEITAGMQVTGPGIPNGTTVLAVGSNSVQISQNATADETNQTFVFTNSGPISVQVAQNNSFVPNVNTILIARRSGNVIYLGVNTSQMVLRDGEFKPLLGSGYFDIYTGLAGQNLSAGTVVYISPGPSDSGRTQGAFYPLDCSAANASIRGTFAGIVITAVNSGQTATVVFSGFYEFPSVTPGLEYYADPTNPGGITSTPPSASGQKIVPVGVGVPFGFGSATASLLVSGGSGSSGIVPAYLLFYQEIIGHGNGSQVAFNTTQPILNASSLFVYIDGVILPMSQWSLSGNTVTLNTAPGTGQEVYAEYVLANQVYLSAFQEVPTPVGGSNSVFQITGTPPSAAGILVFIDGLALESTQWSSAIVSGNTQITLSTPLAPGQDIYVIYFTPLGGSVSGAENEGSGVGLFDDLVNGVLNFKSLVAGTNVTITDNHDGTVTIAASASGGGSIEVHGSALSPVSIDPTVGVVPTSATSQVWWIQPSSGSGQVPVTATPPISPGGRSSSSGIGDTLILKSIVSGNYLEIPAVSGVDQNGPISFGPVAQAIQYRWDGGSWSEDYRRV